MKSGDLLCFSEVGGAPLFFFSPFSSPPPGWAIRSTVLPPLLPKKYDPPFSPLVRPNYGRTPPSFSLPEGRGPPLSSGRDQDQISLTKMFYVPTNPFSSFPFSFFPLHRGTALILFFFFDVSESSLQIHRLGRPPLSLGRKGSFFFSGR